MMFAIVIHGGAGTIPRSDLTEAEERNITNVLQEILDQVYEMLRRGGTALDSVEKAVVEMEDSPLFNAGRGSVFTRQGTHEMDAAIMDGRNLRAGAVACVSTVKNPIRLARHVMESTNHVLLAGEGAEEFAIRMDCEMRPTEYFFSERRLEQLLRAQRSGDETFLDHDATSKRDENPEKEGASPELGKRSVDVKSPTGFSSVDEDGGSAPRFPTDGLAGSSPNAAESSVTSNVTEKSGGFGTVGAVALDTFGNLAAATSTGGMTNKMVGRIGDTPLIGAGTYANNKTCAISATGNGEDLMRSVIAHDISCRMEYQGMTLEDACDRAVHSGNMREIGGRGGVIGVDILGNICMTFNTSGMYRAAKTSRGLDVVSIYRENGNS